MTSPIHRLAALLVAASCGCAVAQQTYLQPFTPAVNLADRQSGAYLGKAGYDIPAGNAPWSVYQWNNTSNLLPATFPAGAPWAIGNPNTRVKFYPTFGGYSNVYELAAANVPCASGTVDETSELDMFLSPDAMPQPQIGLGTLGQLKFQVGTNVTYSEPQNTCSYNASGYVASLILSTINPPAQTLFVQVDVGGTQPAPTGLSWCPDYETTKHPGAFCVDSSVTNYGGTYLYRYGNALNTLDLLPGLVQIIQSGHAKSGVPSEVLNNDPSNWYIVGVYFGLTNYGGTNVTTQWFEPELRASGGAFCNGTTKTQWICEAPVNPGAGWVNVGGGCYHRLSSVPC